MEEIPTISYFRSEVFCVLPNIRLLCAMDSRSENEYTSNPADELGSDHRFQNGFHTLCVKNYFTFNYFTELSVFVNIYFVFTLSQQHW
jgi:hypothetical protein